MIPIIVRFDLTELVNAGKTGTGIYAIVSDGRLLGAELGDPVLITPGQPGHAVGRTVKEAE